MIDSREIQMILLQFSIFYDDTFSYISYILYVYINTVPYGYNYFTWIFLLLFVFNESFFSRNYKSNHIDDNTL